MPASLPHAGTGPTWDSLSYNEKQTFCGVVLAWYMAQNPKLDILVLKDYRTAKRIGSFDRSGLTLDEPAFFFRGRLSDACSWSRVPLDFARDKRVPSSPPLK